MKVPSVCVGIVTRNRAGILPKALDSVLGQTMAGVQLAVIDDGSSDGTVDLASQFPEVRWFRRPTSLGYISARNDLMADGDFDYFVSLDDDAWFLGNDELSLAIEYLEKNKMVAAVAFDILSNDRPNAVARGTPHPVAMFIGCGHVLRMSAVREVGAYELAPGNYGGEEKDLCLRLIDAGYQIVRLPGTHVWHDKTLVERHIPAQHRSGVCNDLVMTLRRTPILLLPAALPAKIYRHAKFSLLHGLMLPCLQGFKLFARSIPTAWRTRRPVRAATLRAYVRLART